MKLVSNKTIVWFYPHLNFWMGGTKFIYEILSRITTDYDAAVVCNGGSKDVIQKFTDAKVKVDSILSLNSNSMLYWLLLPAVLIIEVFKASNKFISSDIRMATLFPSNFVCAVLSQIHNKPYYYYCFEPFPFLQNKDFINTFPLTKRMLLHVLRILYAPLDTWATKQAAQVYTLNEVTQKMIANTYGVDSIVTLMGVDAKHFSPQPENEVAVDYKGKYLITHSTDYTTMKRTDLAIETFAHIVKKHPEARLIVTSTQPNSPEKSKYVQLAARLGVEKSVVFMGLIPYEDLPKYYAASVCLLSCSHDEMLGTTSSNLPVKEALACGVPAIRARITHEDVEDGVSGFLVDPRDTVTAAEKAIYLIEHPLEASQMGVKGREKILKHYQWNAVINKLVTSFNER